MAEQSSVPHVLIVDDNEMNRDVLSRRLARHGMDVSAAEDGEQALQQMRARRFDLVFLDIMMPKLNGYQVLEQAKSDPALRDMPIIVISALDELDSVVKCIELGAEDYLFKPFNPVLLKARVNAVLEKNRLRMQSSGSISSDIKAGVEDILNAARLLSAATTGLTTQQRAQVELILERAEAIAMQLEKAGTPVGEPPR